MLDKRTAAVLSAVNSLCKEGKYEVVESEDLLRFSRMPLGAADIENALSYLFEKGYIDLKYTDRARGVYCLYPLPSGRTYAEKAEEKRTEKKRTSTHTFLFVALSSFIGSLISSLLVYILGVITG